VLLREGSIVFGIANIFANNIAGLTAALLGFVLARWLG
jgi:fluoride ion exporter CrcB/FEX